MRAKLGNVHGLLGTGPDNSRLLEPTGRETLSSDPDNKFSYEENTNDLFLHKDEQKEIQYINYALIEPIQKASEATYQNELERWANQEKDAFKQICSRLSKSKYLLGDNITEADKLLYQTLLRHDHIYYYLYKLNFAKSYDFPDIKRYLNDLSKIDEIKNSIDIENEKEAAFRELEDDRNPYHLIFRGPQHEY